MRKKARIEIRILQVIRKIKILKIQRKKVAKIMVVCLQNAELMDQAVRIKIIKKMDLNNCNRKNRKNILSDHKRARIIKIVFLRDNTIKQEK